MPAIRIKIELPGEIMLIGMEFIREVIETIILTGRLRDHSPVSLLMIAQPESGKTSVVLSKTCKSVIALTDVTSGGLRELCKNRPEVSHLVLNDMVAISAHKSSVVGATISMLNAMTEEGIMATAYPGSVEVHENGKRAIIASIPSGMVNDKRSWWNKSGFSSRMLPLRFVHSKSLTIRIKSAINGGFSGKAHATAKDEFKVPDVPLSVAVPKTIALEIANLAETSKSMGDIGYRRLKQFRALACAHAVWPNNWKAKQVTKRDVEFLELLVPYISFNRGMEI
jgi:hypothetical protein